MQKVAVQSIGVGGWGEKSEVQCIHVDTWAGHGTQSYPHIEGSRGMHGGMGGSLTSLYVGVPALTNMASRGVPPDPQTMFSRQQAELQDCWENVQRGQKWFKKSSKPR